MTERTFIGKLASYILFIEDMDKLAQIASQSDTTQAGKPPGS